MLFLTVTLFTEYAMPEYCFFKKGKHIIALERSEAAKSAQLATEGWQKQFEELSAPDAKRALNRFYDIRKEEQTTEHAFSTGAAFISLTVGLVALAGWLFLR